MLRRYGISRDHRRHRRQTVSRLRSAGSGAQLWNSISPFIWMHVTLQVEKATVVEVITNVCTQIECKYVLNENHLEIKPSLYLIRYNPKTGRA
jgi:hypothetical protein